MRPIGSYTSIRKKILLCIPHAPFPLVNFIIFRTSRSDSIFPFHSPMDPQGLGPMGRSQRGFLYDPPVVPRGKSFTNEQSNLKKSLPYVPPSSVPLGQFLIMFRTTWGDGRGDSTGKHVLFRVLQQLLDFRNDRRSVTIRFLMMNAAGNKKKTK